MIVDINIKALSLFGHENLLKVLNAGIEVNEPMLEFAQVLCDKNVPFNEAIKSLQALYPKVQQSIVPGNVYYIHQPTVVVYGNVDGGAIHNGSSSGSSTGSSSSRKASSLSRKQKKNPNGDWQFKGDRVFLNSQWHKAVTDCDIPLVEGAVIIQTNDNGSNKKVGYYSKTPLLLKGFKEFHNTIANPILKYGKGPEGYYYIKSSILSALNFLESSEEVEETQTTVGDSSNTSTTDVQVDLEDVDFDF